MIHQVPFVSFLMEKGVQVHFNVQVYSLYIMFQINYSNAFRHHERGMA